MADLTIQNFPTEATEYGDGDYLPMSSSERTAKIKAKNFAQKALAEVKNLPTAITTFRTGDVIPVDGPSSTAKMTAEALLQATTQNALAGNVVREFVPDKQYYKNDYFADSTGIRMFATDYKGEALPPRSTAPYVKLSDFCKRMSFDSLLSRHGYVALDGSFRAGIDEWYSTEYMPVECLDAFYYTVYNSGVRIVSFYDAEKNYLGGETPSDSGLHAMSEFNPPQGTVYAVVSLDKRYAYGIFVKEAFFYSNRIDSFEFLKPRAGYTKYGGYVNIDQIPSASFISNRYAFNNGIIAASCPINVHGIKIRFASILTVPLDIKFYVVRIASMEVVESFSISIDTLTNSTDVDVLFEKKIDIGNSLFVRIPTGVREWSVSQGGVDQSKNIYIKFTSDSSETIESITSRYNKCLSWDLITDSDLVNTEQKVFSQDTCGTYIKRWNAYKSVVFDNFISESNLWRFVGDASNWEFDYENHTLRPLNFGGYINNFLTNTAYINRNFCADKREATFVITLYSDTKMNIHCFRTPNGGLDNESMVTIDCANGLLGLCSNRAKQPIPDDYVSTSPFEVSNGKTYLVSLSKDIFHFEISICDYASGKRLSHVEVDGWAGGSMSGRYGVSLSSGTAFLLRRVNVSILNNPDVCFVGDSITEGVGSTDLNTSWANLARMACGNSLISAAGGDSIDGVFSRFESEFNLIKPKVMVVFIGWNRILTQAEVEQLVTKCDNIGAKLIMGMIYKPGFLSQNLIIESLGIPSIRFDLSNCVNNDPAQGVNRYLCPDGAHPDGLGNVVMFERLQLDTSLF